MTSFSDDDLGHKFDEGGRCDCGATVDNFEPNEPCEYYQDSEQDEKPENIELASPDNPASSPSNYSPKKPAPDVNVGSSTQQESTDRAQPSPQPIEKSTTAATDQIDEKTQATKKLKDIVTNITDLNAAVDAYIQAGYRVIGVTGMRGAGKSVFLMRLIDTLMDVDVVQIPPDSLSFTKIRELKKNKLLARTDEVAFYFFRIKQPFGSSYDNTVFIDFSGEHLGPDANSQLGGDKATILAFLKRCHAYIMLYPLDDLDTYEGNDDFHEENLGQMISRLIESGENDQGHIDKPLAVVFSKADIYRDELKPYEQDYFNPLKVAQRYFRSYRRIVGFFPYVRFLFASTGEWDIKIDKDGTEYQTLKDPKAPSYGLLDVYDFVKHAPPTNVWKTKDMVEKYAFKLNLLAKIPFLGRRLIPVKSNKA